MLSRPVPQKPRARSVAARLRRRLQPPVWKAAVALTAHLLDVDAEVVLVRKEDPRDAHAAERVLEVAATRQNTQC